MPKTFLIIHVLVVLAMLHQPHAFKIRYGRERSRILKLKKRKGVFTERLDNLLKTRGIGLFPLFALPESQEEQGVDLTQLTTPQKVKRYPKNPLVKDELARLDPVFREDSSVSTVKSSAGTNNRPGALEPRAYARHFIEVDPWDIHPSNLRVRGRYFSKLFQQELREPFKRHKNDTGSSEVQIAALTARIDYLRKHLEEHKKDIKARLNVIKLGNQRRRLLGYLYRTKPEVFERVVKSFNICFDTSPYDYKKLLPKFSHMYHNNTKRYSNAKEAREARLRYTFIVVNQM